MNQTPVFGAAATNRRTRRVLLNSPPGICAVAGYLLASLAGAAETPFSLADLTIEELMNESVTSVSKKETSLDLSPAAISVITGDDIRRLGITSIPEALRLIPGLDVARVGANEWAISSRGFNHQFANKLLVLMDGRSVYTPSFGGVFWDAQDMVLEDLDSIEVIRGPGATLWGANAVNGVINITSKHTKDTQGMLASAFFGMEEQPGVSLRYGGALGSDLHYRVYVKGFNRDGLVDPAGNSVPDDWNSLRGGFRADWEPTGDDLVTLQGDYYSMNTGGNVTLPLFTPPFSRTSAADHLSRGGNLLGRWTRTLSDESQVSIQAYFDHFRNDSGLAVETRDTADIQLEHRFPLGSWNDIVWGLGYRFTTDEFINSSALSFTPVSEDLNLYTAFVQDEITVVRDRLRLILGSKFEHNDYTDWEIQPGARLLWTPTDRQTAWASASYAAGTPSRVFRGGRLVNGVDQSPGGPLIETAFIGNSNLVSETVLAYELGYRIAPAPNLSVDLTAFYNVYDNLIGVAPGSPQLEGTPVPHLVVPLNFANNISGDTYGAEASVQWKPSDLWRLTANYSWLHMDLEPDNDPASGASPQQQVSLRSYLDLPGDLEFNCFASWVDGIKSLGQGGATTAIAPYLRVDAGFVWHPEKSLEVGIWGQNLCDDQHAEFTSQSTRGITEIPRSVVGKITWRF